MGQELNLQRSFHPVIVFETTGLANVPTHPWRSVVDSNHWSPFGDACLANRWIKPLSQHSVKQKSRRTFWLAAGTAKVCLRQSIYGSHTPPLPPEEVKLLDDDMRTMYMAFTIVPGSGNIVKYYF